MTRIGNGSDTTVWWDRWIMDSVPRVPDYRQGSTVDLTLKVTDLFDHHSGVWDRALVYDTFVHKDAEIILKLKPRLNQSDNVVWGLTRNGEYLSKSGYGLLDTLEEFSSPPITPIPPVEKQLWSSLWKTKASPKF